MNTSDMSPHKSLEEYISYFEHLSPRSIRLLEKIADPLIHFTDPFNDTRGVDEMEAVFVKAFEDVQSLKFKVHDKAWGSDGLTAYLKWSCHVVLKTGAQNTITGMSEVQFNADGKVVAHYDHWDAASQFYEKIPVLGALIRFVKKKLSV